MKKRYSDFSIFNAVSNGVKPSNFVYSFKNQPSFLDILDIHLDIYSGSEYSK